MLDILDKYDSLIKFVQNSDEYSKDFLEELINFLYQFEQMQDDENDPKSLIQEWISTIDSIDEDND